MEYTCFQEMAVPLLMEERATSAVDVLHSTASLQLLGSLHAQQQQQQQLQHPDQLTSNYYCTPQFNCPSASWSTTDPTMILSESQQGLQEQPPPPMFSRWGSSANMKAFGDGISEPGAFNGVDASYCGFPTFPNVEHRDSADHQQQNHHAGMPDYVVPDYSVNNLSHLNFPMDTMSGYGSDRMPSCSIDPFSFVGTSSGAGVGVGVPGGFGVDASYSQWMQTYSLLSEQYYNSDALLPQLVSDYYSNSSPLQQQPCTYYNTSSASVDCCGVQEADSCGSSDRDKSTTTEEMNWGSSFSGIRNSDIMMQHMHAQRGCSTSALQMPSALQGGDSMTGLMMPPTVTGHAQELAEEYSSSVMAARSHAHVVPAAATDDVEFPNVPRAPMDLEARQQQQHRNASSKNAVDCREIAPIERVSWMAPSSSDTQVNSHVPTLDPMTLLGSVVAAEGQLTRGSGNNGLLLPPPSSPTSVYNYRRQQRGCYTLDDIPLPPNTRPLAQPSVMAPPSETCGTSSRRNSGYPLASLTNRSSTDDHGSNAGFYNNLYGGGSSQLQLNAPASKATGPPASQNVGVRGGQGLKREHGSDQVRLSPRKPNTTSIEPQSVAARHRRKKISERVRILEKLIPGGNKMDTASMLDEAIDYVRFLQLQVQLLEGMAGPEDDPPAEKTSVLCPKTAGVGAGADGSTSGVAVPATSSSTAVPTSSFNNLQGSGKVDSGNRAAMASGFGSSHLPLAILPSASKPAPVSAPAAASTSPTTPSTTNSPLIISEILQEQLFKQKLCLVSLRQYCPHQQHQHQR